jgi:YHS domain-containing protein
MISWILRLLLVLIVVRLVWRFLAGIIDGLTPAAPQSAKKASVPLVRDPVCGTYVVRAKALTIEAPGPKGQKGQGQTQYFCSERCRDEYARGGRGGRGFGAPPLREAK